MKLISSFMLSLFIFFTAVFPGMALANSCKFHYEVELNLDERIELALKIKHYRYEQTASYTEKEANWMLKELLNLQSRLNLGTEKIYKVYGANTTSTEFDLFKEDIDKTIKYIKLYKKLNEDERIANWIMHRTLLVSKEKLKKLNSADSFADIDAFFKDIGWSGVKSQHDDIVAYSNYGYTPPIRLAPNQFLSVEDLKGIKSAVEAGRTFSTKQAFLSATRYIKDSNELIALKEAGFKSHIDSRLKVKTYIHSETGARIMLPLVEAGENVRVFTKQEQDSFYKAAVDGTDFITEDALRRLAYVGRAKPEEIRELEKVTYQYQVQDLLIRMGWITNDLATNRRQFINPIFKNTIDIPIIEVGHNLPELENFQISDLLDAVIHNKNYSVRY